ncbi:replication factor C, putative [Rhizoctonia solani AG-3 Rhs1AP]|uniref:Replication factor C, putative n=2 Tax=Rhizoctonia solani AG-3 TaxID=1086053 RepID=X8JFS5_9AGAM|nr:replication factor C, putative [Rhizoctonia solani AG-3 Rhs1AP]KEP52981.1 putative replication factor C [Rhizoctonia solani 123E]
MAIIRFAISKLLYIRLPTSRRETLEAYCAQLLSTEQLARWWPKLPQADQAMAGNPPVRSLRADASYFCEAFAEISGRFGSQVAMDKLLPLVIPVISSWTDSGKLANVDDTNTAATIASKGKKAGNALGEARTHYYQEYWKRKTHFETYDDPGLKELNSMMRFRESCVTVGGSNQQLQEFTIYLLVGKDAEDRQVTISIGAGVGPSKMVARELAAEEAVKSWHVVESYMEVWGLTKPIELAKEPKPLRERDRTRAGAPNLKKD